MEKSGYLLLVEDPSNTSFDKMCLLMKVLVLATNAKANRESLNMLLTKTFQAKFVNHLMTFSINLFIENVRPNQMLSYFSDLSIVLDKFSHTMASVAMNRIFVLVEGCLMSMKLRSPEQCKELISVYEGIKNFLEKEKKKWENQEQRNSTSYRRGYHDHLQPPNDFREMPVMPTSSEINDPEKPFLRRNIIQGQYDNIDHYLDVQFRLLREDFVRPLRKGIVELKTNVKSQNRELYVYKDVRIVGTEVKNFSLIHNIRLKLPKSFKAENSKRLLFGNFVCFSSDNFRTVLFGSVAERSPEMLKKGILGIKFDSEVKKISYTTLTMVESRSYFIAYKHVLTALQKISEDTFPMEEFIVHVETDMPLPEYLDYTSHYDLQCIRSNSMMKASELHNALFNLRNAPAGEYVNVPVLRQVRITEDITFWPSCENLNLDHSQRRALRSALTSKLAIIQGPPGTGKTFLGLKIAQILLNNSHYWKGEGEKFPILVVCYTNHALDQFLEGMAQFTKSLVRVGSRTKSALIQPYQINSLLKDLRSQRTVPQEIHQNRIDIMQKLQQLQADIAPWKVMVGQLCDPVGILKLNSFLGEKIIPDDIVRVLQRYTWTLETFLLDSSFSKDIVGKVDESPLHRINSRLYGMSLQDDDDDDYWQDAEDYFAEEEETRRLDEDFEDTDSFIGQPRDIMKYSITLEMLEKELETLANKKKKANVGQVMQLEKKMEEIENKWKLLYYGLNLPLDIEKAQALERRNITFLKMDDRWMLYKLWLHRLTEKALPNLREMEEEFEQTSAAFNEIKDNQFLHIMRHAAVVGMTTTGAAQYSNILQALAPAVVIIEEAAEILEAHVVTSLTGECKHLIMIGDHQQLQPSATVYELAKEYGLETSLFERLIKNGLAYETLEYQHRMRPSISRLLVPSIYPELKDHESVELHPHVRGMQRDVFFIAHKHLEKKGEDENNSKENAHEANFIMALCRHLRLQGYSSEDITILTPYTGQLFLLKKVQRKFEECQGVRICVVDNFQGEENKIILLSLVRSNEGGVVGFLKKENRICVALSRAKHGLYVIGNMKQLQDSSDLWKQIFKDLNDDNSIGSSIVLQCENHDVLSRVATDGDFLQNSPEGGCTRPCSFSLPVCGHKCPKVCHMTDLKHKDVKCPLPCPKILCERKHRCPRKCWEECRPCVEKVPKEFPCGHVHNVECSRYNLRYRCPTTVERILPHCEHTAKMKCYEDPKTFPCPVPCDIRPPCGHKCTRECHVNDDPKHLTYKCEQPCPRSPEGCLHDHKCMKACYENCGPCFFPVKKKALCGHVHSVECHTPREDIICNQKCKRLLPCNHYCPRKCKELCGGCTVTVKKKIQECQHEIEVECGQPALRDDCENKCIKLLPCGHKCQARCKDPCTANCKVQLTSANKCPKGHIINVPCYNYRTVRGEAAWIYCTKPCGAELACGHICKGMCGSCLHGRLHETCSEKCEKPLVCGHICKKACSSSCPPCQEPCPMKCVHSRCAQKCGEPCSHCQERCSNGCTHKKCKDPCWKKCENLCEKPCPKKLKCGHKCVGFCGDPCPPLCRTCHREDLTEIFFGSEDDDDARFVLLEDCGHVIEAEGLKAWLSRDDGEISMKFCPRCKKPVYNNRRNQEAVLAAYENVRQVKNQYFKKKPRQAMMDIQKLLDEMEGLEGKDIENIRKSLPQVPLFQVQHIYSTLSDDQISLYRFQVQTLKKIDLVLQSNPSCRDKLKDHLKVIKKRVMKQSHHISPQMVDELTCELQRMSILSAYWEFIKKSEIYKNPKLVKIQIQLEQLMSPTAKFDEEREEEVRKLLQESEKYIGGLGISDEERISILDAMGLKQGHWYKCPNGHIYCITECGGAMVEANCPECGARIGGGSHSLRSDNQVATEMDGAEHPAWSEHYNDMENFIFD
ncbi:NFX1-type zinc finger-containing protein 1-like isoform X2 [Macrobrachium nipponense]